MDKMNDNERRKALNEFRKQVRQAVADYMQSEGCDCCRSVKDHQQHTARLAKLLRVQKYDDSSGFDFQRFRSKPFQRFRSKP
jgi:hypothetical protein